MAESGAYCERFDDCRTFSFGRVSFEPLHDCLVQAWVIFKHFQFKVTIYQDYDCLAFFGGGMKLWRIVNHRFAQEALSGFGAQKFGARWNVKGRRVVYCAASKASVMLETFSQTQIARTEFNRQFLLILIDVPDEVSRETIRLADLPSDWTNSFELTQKLGEQWLHGGRTCILKVPSQITPSEANYLINPEHRDFELLFVRPPQPWESYEGYTDDDSVHSTYQTRGEQLTLRDRLGASFGPKELFICHASEDESSVVVPLRDALFRLGVSCWVDFAEIRLGDSIVEKVNEGLATSRYVLVVISPAFLRQGFHQQPLRSAFMREGKQGVKVVLPVLVNYPNERVDFAALPFLEDKRCYTWRGDADEAAFEITRAVRPEAANMFTRQRPAFDQAE